MPLESLASVCGISVTGRGTDCNSRVMTPCMLCPADPGLEVDDDDSCGIPVTGRGVDCDARVIASCMLHLSEEPGARDIFIVVGVASYTPARLAGTRQLRGDCAKVETV
jgi:hypothetical protein